MVLRKEEFFCTFADLGSNKVLLLLLLLLLSPRFFNVYIDDLSIALLNSKYGCTFGGCSVNHLSYADDMVILSPSATASQQLLG